MFGKFETPQGNSQYIDILDAIYLSCVTITTLGYGDITPVGIYSKLMCGLESVVGILTIGFFLNSVAQEINRNNVSEESRKFDSIRCQAYYRVHGISEEIRRLVWAVEGEKRYLSYGSTFGQLIRDCRKARFATDPVQLFSVGMYEPTREALDELEASTERLARDLGEAIYPFLQFIPAEFSEPIVKFQTRFQNIRSDAKPIESLDEDEIQRRAYNHIIIARGGICDVQSALFQVATKIQTHKEFYSY